MKAFHHYMLIFGSHIMVVAMTLLLLCLCSCTDDDILTNIASQPTFELNNGTTQHLGVLFPGRTTSTQKLLLYNQNNGTLKLESLTLRGGEESLFRINVDGMAGTSFTEPDYLRIAKGDSLHVLLEASFLGHPQERETEYDDYLDIRCNGKLTSIRLAVTVKSVEELHNDTIRQDTIWAADGVDKLVYGSLVIPEGVTLTVEQGMTLFLHDQADISVHGTLKLLGSLDEPVRLLGDRTDSIFSNLAYVDMSAQWKGITIHPTSHGNVFDHAEIMGMTMGIDLMQENLDETLALTALSAGTGEALSSDVVTPTETDGSSVEPQLIIRNSLIKNSEYALITATSTTMVLENTLLMNCGGTLLSLQGGAYDVTHCTLANYQFWTAYPAYDLMLSNYYLLADTVKQEVSRERSPLYHCSITNTLVYGNGPKPNVALDYERYFGSITPADSVFHYRFDHCLLKASGEDDDDFIETLWGDDPMYKLVDMPNYLCDPHLLPESPAIGRGTPSTLQRLPLDKDDHPRQNPPSIGCYEP